jgi:cell division protease FtsH
MPSKQNRTTAATDVRTPGQLDLLDLASDAVLIGKADVSDIRERHRIRKVRRAMLVVLVVECYFAWRVYVTRPHFSLWLPGLSLLGHLGKFGIIFLVLGGMFLVVMAPFMFAGRSPHKVYRASDIDVRLSDIRGADGVKCEVINTLNLFLGFRTFARDMGGTARRGVLFEGSPGTGKTFMAKAMAGEAGVPFLFVSSSAFQSMYFGQTNRKIRSYFKALRKAARQEGGAIGFIEEIDAIGGARTGMGSGRSEGVTGVVNELLIQLQSFDEPTRPEAFKGALVSVVNRWLPEGHQLSRKAPSQSNVLVIGATNRTSDLDPALMRPGRFDRSITFQLPTRAERADILSYYLGKKAHDPDLDDAQSIDRLAAMTIGYTPVMLERLLDEALIVALRRSAREMTWKDVHDAKLVTELGMPSEAAVYTEAERSAVATHEAGHCTVAYFEGKTRSLEVLSIKKRTSSLGLLAHGDLEERFTMTKTEIKALLQIALGGMAAEEIYFGEAGSGPASDLESATQYAAAMVGAYGMGDSLISYMGSATPGNIVDKVLGSEDARTEVSRLLNEAKQAAAGVLVEHPRVVEALRDALLERDELIGPEITEVIETAIASDEPSGTRPAGTPASGGRQVIPENAPPPSSVLPR